MSNRLRRTIGNPRWWLLLPAAPLILAVAATALLFRLAADALTTAQDAGLEFVEWAKNGAIHAREGDER